MTPDSTSRLKRLVSIAGFILLIFGAKLWFIQYAASSLPFWDQWDAESEMTLRPWLEGRLTLEQLAKPHNEHRPIATKLLTLGLFAANEQWDAMLETTANAALYTGFAILLLLFSRYWLQGGRFVAFGALLVLLFTLPFSWENSLFGFQSQFYFLAIFSLGHLWLTLRSDRFSWGWAGGQLCALAALGSMASGMLSSASVIAVLVHRVVVARRASLQQTVSGTIALACVLIGLGTRVVVAGHNPLKAHSITEWVAAVAHILSWPGASWYPLSFVLALPLLGWFVRSILKKSEAGPHAVRLGLTIWFYLQVAAMAYARGAGGGVLAPRYLDLLAIGVALSGLVVAHDLPRRFRIPITTAWCVAILISLWQSSQQNWQEFIAAMPARNRALEGNVRGYLQTGDPSFLNKRPWDEIPYPHGGALSERLASLEIRAAMPAVVRATVPLAAGELRTVPKELEAASSWPVAFSSWTTADSESPRRWQSARQKDSELTMLRFQVAGDLGRPGSRLHLAVRSEAGAVEIIPTPAPGLRWKTINIHRPPGEWWLEAIDDDPAAWFAVTQPVELGTWSYFCQKLLKAHGWVLGAGFVLAIGGLLLWLPRSYLLNGVGALVAFSERARQNPKAELSQITAPVHRPLFGLFLASLVLAGIATLTKRSTTLAPTLPATVSGTFVVDGHFPGESLQPTRPPPRLWGSWAGSDGNTGTLRLGPFPTPRTLKLALSGYPGNAGLRLYLVWADGAPLPLSADNVGERWSICAWELPPERHEQPVTLVAEDDSRALTGWFGLSEPIPTPRWVAVNPRFLEALAAVGLCAWLFLSLALAADQLVVARVGVPPQWRPLLAWAVVAAIGYGAFWFYFAHRWIGIGYTIGLLGVALWSMLGGLKSKPAAPEQAAIFGLHALFALGYVAVLYLFANGQDFYGLAANRFIAGLPMDNELPHHFAERLYSGSSLKPFVGDWLSSDRPPLQTGWLLLGWPWPAWLGIESRTASGVASVWFQLLWIPAAYGWLRTATLGRRRALLWTAILGTSGFFVLHSVFTWPKLSAGAFVAGSMALWTRRSLIANRRLAWLWGCGLAGLAWLAHGGSAFALAAAGLWILVTGVRTEWKSIALGSLAFVVLVAPWMAYQKLYDPPGDRLIKWHIGGQVPLDSRSVGAVLRENYGALTWHEIAHARATNFENQFKGRWSGLFSFNPAGAVGRRNDEFFYTFRAFTWWNLGWLLLPFAAWRLTYQPKPEFTSVLRLLLAWGALALVVWCIVMFLPYQAIVHQGSFAMMLAWFIGLSLACEAAGPKWIWCLAVLQIGTLLMTWLVGQGATERSFDLTAGLVATTTVIATTLLIIRADGATVRSGLAPNAASAACKRGGSEASAPQA